MSAIPESAGHTKVLRGRRGRLSAPRERGFTLMELVIALLIIGILTVVALPKLDTFFSPSADAARDSVIAALRQAQSTAYAHRRMVCVNAVGNSLTMTQSALHPANSCSGNSLRNVRGSNNFLDGFSGTTISVNPSSTVHFQPSGNVSTDVAGKVSPDFVFTITTSGQSPLIVTISGRSASIQ